MTTPTPVPSPAAPGPGPSPARAAINSADLAAWIERRRRFRARLTAVVVTLLSLVVAGAAVYWTAFSRHLVAKAQLERQGFLVDWDLNLGNIASGGVTNVSYQRPATFWSDFTPPSASLESMRSLRHVRWLDLSNVHQLRDDDCAVVADLPELEDLEWNRTGVRDARDPYPVLLLTDRALAHIGGLKRLKTLGLEGNKITDAGLKSLAGLQALELIDLEGTRITDAGLDALVGLKSLKTLRVADTKVTAEGIARFNAKRPDVEVIRQTYEDVYGTPTP